MNARTQSWVDQHATWMRNTVHRLGWAIQYVGDEECSRPGCACPPRAGPSFAFTVGLFGLRYPELLIFGAPPETAAAVLNDLGERVRAGGAATGPADQVPRLAAPDHPGVGPEPW